MLTRMVSLFLVLLLGACAGQQVVRDPLVAAEADYAASEAQKVVEATKFEAAKAAAEAAKAAAEAKAKAYAGALVTDAQAKEAAAKVAIERACKLDTTGARCSPQVIESPAQVAPVPPLARPVSPLAQLFVDVRIDAFDLAKVKRVPGTAAPSDWTIRVEADNWVGLLIGGTIGGTVIYKTPGFVPGVYRFYQDRVEKVGD